MMVELNCREQKRSAHCLVADPAQDFAMEFAQEFAQQRPARRSSGWTQHRQKKDVHALPAPPYL
jgi:hypothetical protein